MRELDRGRQGEWEERERKQTCSSSLLDKNLREDTKMRRGKWGSIMYYMHMYNVHCTYIEIKIWGKREWGRDKYSLKMGMDDGFTLDLSNPWFLCSYLSLPTSLKPLHIPFLSLPLFLPLPLFISVSLLIFILLCFYLTSKGSSVYTQTMDLVESRYFIISSFQLLHCTDWF